MGGLSRSDIDEILRLVDNSHFDELRLEVGDVKIELRRRGAASRPADAPAGSPPPADRAPVAHPAPPSAAAAPAADGTAVPSPLLGTFYRAPKPGADPFVDVGHTVTADTVIGIVEVMKLMNPVTAGVAGVVTEIVAADGMLVEHGQPLIRVRTA